MFFSQQEQMLVVLESVLLGVGLALYYDVLRALRRHFRAGTVLTAVCDTVFWLGLLAALFEFSIAFAAGQSRYYVLAGAGAGAALYFALPGELIFGLLCALLDTLGFLRRKVMLLVHRLQSLTRKLELRKKIVLPLKKFAKSPSIFRGKGIK